MQFPSRAYRKMRRLYILSLQFLDGILHRLPKIKFFYRGQRYVITGHRRDDDIFSRISKCRKFYEWEVLEFARSQLPETGSVVFDIGANIGNHSIFFATQCGSSVHAFECNPTAVDILQKNLNLNNCISKVSVHAVAVSSEPNLTLVQPPEKNLGMARTATTQNGIAGVKLPTISLDSLAKKVKRCDLLKMDIEGGELSALQSGKEFIRLTRPLIIIEAQGRDRYAAVENILTELGYSTGTRFESDPHLYVFRPHS